MAAIDAEITRLQAIQAEAIKEGDATAGAISARDLRYWTNRRATAELVEAAGSEQVRFGSHVRIRRQDGSETDYRLVGTDEADPKHGTLSYVAPLAQAMMGKVVGDTFVVASREDTIVQID
jgi:transcription elongation GreA/GreB family factor